MLLQVTEFHSLLNATQLCEDVHSVGGQSCRNMVPLGQTGSIPFGCRIAIHYHSAENTGDRNFFKETSLFRVSVKEARLFRCTMGGTGHKGGGSGLQSAHTG